MRFVPFEPLGRALSQLALGTAAWTRAEQRDAAVLLDTFLDLGGNVVDTARAYGESESVVGPLVCDRRADVVLVTKGGHHDRASERGPLRRRVTPEDVGADLETSLATLRTEPDLYLLHRDDASHPVGPILAALNDHRRAGRIRSFGASNWTTERLDEAARHAEEHGLEAPTSSSPYLGLLRWREPPWPECVSARDDGSLAWYARTQLSVLAWSPLAAGFLARRGDPAVTRAWDTPDGRALRARAEELGRRIGATAAQVALAWLVALPFPVVPVVGARTVAELREAVAALELELAPDDLAFLDAR